MIALLVGLVAVAAVLTGWFLGSRPAAAAQAEAKDARERLTALERDHAVASEQAGRLRLTEESLKAATDERNRAQQDVAQLSQTVADLRRQNARLAAENNGYHKDVQSVTSGAADEEQARLNGYARPGERIYLITAPPSPTPATPDPTPGP